MTRISNGWKRKHLLLPILGMLGWGEPAMATNEIRVLTFNLRYASAADGANNWINANQSPERRVVALGVIQNRQPDIIGFQEGEDGQLDYLAAALPEYGFERRKPSGGSGNENAAFAWRTNRLDLLDRGLFSLGTEPGGGYWNNPPDTNFNPYAFFPNMGLGFPRIALWGRFRWKDTGQELLFYTTHFDFNDEPQVRSAALIVDDAKARNDRMPMSPLAIVVGDFNSSHLNRDWQLFTGSLSTNGITGDFTDSWWQVKGTWNNAGTIHGFAGGVIPEAQRIDWILHRGGFTATNAEIVTDSVLATNISNGTTRTQYPSDHYPVAATLRLPPVPPDVDRDGLPDAKELVSPISQAADPDSDNDLLLDGQEDLNGNGTNDGGETDPSIPSSPQKPTDIRNYAMDGMRDHPATLVASHGLDLYTRFDGRYLYVATQDAGEGSDHFIFVSTNPAQAVAAPWAKSGQVGSWLAFLADENDSDFTGWFTSAGWNTNLFTCRAATYYQNGGRLEGVIDLAQFLGSGFTQTIYIAAAPFGSADGGAMFPAAQAPEGNGDTNLVGTNEYVRISTADIDGDGINDTADADADGDGLPDAWETAHGLTGGALEDVDADRATARHEYLACTDPTNPASVLELQITNGTSLSWRSLHGKTTTLWRSASASFSPDGPWSCIATSRNATTLPTSNTVFSVPVPAGFYRLIQSP